MLRITRLRIIGNQSGLTLIGVMVALGVSAIVIYIMASMNSAQQKEMSRLFQKLALLDTSNIIRTVLSDEQRCGYNLSQSGTFDATSVPTVGVPLTSKLISLSILVNGTVPTAPTVVEASQEIPTAQGVTATEIYVTNWMHDGSGSYTADLFVDVISSAGPIAPVRIAGINIVSVGAIGARTITRCKLGPIATGASVLVFSGDADSVTALAVSKTFFLPPGTWTLLASTGLEHGWFNSAVSLEIDGTVVYTFPGGGADPLGTNWIPVSGIKSGVVGNRDITVAMDEAPPAAWGGKANFMIFAIKE